MLQGHLKTCVGINARSSNKSSRIPCYVFRLFFPQGLQTLYGITLSLTSGLTKNKTKPHSGWRYSAAFQFMMSDELNWPLALFLLVLP